MSDIVAKLRAEVDMHRRVGSPKSRAARFMRAASNEIERLRQTMFEKGDCDGPEGRSDPDIAELCWGGCQWLEEQPRGEGPSECAVDGWEIPRGE